LEKYFFVIISYKTDKAFLNPDLIYKKIGLAEGAKVAEFGCGRTGIFSFSAAKIVGDKGIVYALDILKDVLEGIKSRSRFEGYYNILTVWTDLEKIGAAAVPEKSVDVGFFVNVFFQLKNRNNALAEAARLLKDGAILVVVDWTKRIDGKLGPEENQMVNIDDLVALAKEHSFVLQENFPASDYHFCLIFKKEEKR